MISVLMPVYNAEKYLKEAVASILAQTYDDFELLIVDDGSTDSSVQIASEFSDSRIRLLPKKHNGLIETLNYGLEHARGQWIARMDADDIALPDRFDIQMKYISSHKDVVAVGGAAYLIDAEGRKTGCLTVPPGNHEDLVNNLLYPGRGVSLIHPTVMMRTETARALEGYRRQFAVSEDTDMWLRISCAGRLCSVPEPVLLLRKHPDNVSIQKTRTNIESRLAAIAFHIIWQKTGIDLIKDNPDKWQLCVSILNRLIQKYRVVETIILKREIAALLRNKSASSFFAALCRIATSPRLSMRLALGNAQRRAAELAASEIIKSISSN